MKLNDDVPDLPRLGTVNRRQRRAPAWAARHLQSHRMAGTFFSKHSFFGVLALCGLLASASGQGWVHFANRVPGLVDAPVSGCSGLLSGAGYTAQLFGGPAGAADNNLMALLPQTFFRTTPSQAGIVTNVDVVVPGVAPGRVARLQMRVWENRGGTIQSWLAAVHDPTLQSGASPSFDSPPLTPQNTSEPVVLTGLRSFTLCPLRFSTPVPLGNGVYSIGLSAVPGRAYAIETASNLVDWLPLLTITNAAATVQFKVTNAPLLRARFYRARVAP